MEKRVSREQDKVSQNTCSTTRCCFLLRLDMVVLHSNEQQLGNWTRLGVSSTHTPCIWCKPVSKPDKSTHSTHWQECTCMCMHSHMYRGGWGGCMCTVYIRLVWPQHTFSFTSFPRNFSLGVLQEGGEWAMQISCSNLILCDYIIFGYVCR